MPWKKLGRIFDPAETKSSWFRTHAALPVVQRRSDDLHRVYFSGRDAENRAARELAELLRLVVAQALEHPASASRR